MDGLEGEKDIRLILPPAPSFVLEEEGPNAFCEKFGKRLEEVFPINFEVIPKFEIEPHLRSIRIHPD